MSDLPTPEQILEELADKTLEQIARMAPVAFDDAIAEMTRYHRFLLELSSTPSTDGRPFSFAEIQGDSWMPPHREWTGQYRRLFERAAERIPEDGHFIKSLAYTPLRLMKPSSGQILSPDVVKKIVDLEPMMMHMIEAWLTKRTLIEASEGQSAEPRLALSGSDAKAYLGILPELIGSWESLLQKAASIYGWSKNSSRTDDECWSTYSESWVFLWQHLTNTAYCLAVAVWNEDEAGADHFHEALVRWPENLRIDFDYLHQFRHRRLVYPDLLKKNWHEALAQVEPLCFRYDQSPSPNQVFSGIISGAHDDVLLLVSALLLRWSIEGKQVSDIGGRNARAVLRRERGDEMGSRSRSRVFNFSSTFLDVLRLEMAGERYSEGSYARDLDQLVNSLDNMTERRVVPGRVYSPSTLHDRDGLGLSIAAIILAAHQEGGDASLSRGVETLAEEEEFLPEGDRSLRKCLQEISRLKSVLEEKPDQIFRGLRLLTSESVPDLSIESIIETLKTVETAINSVRQKRLKDRDVDATQLERIRSAVEDALLKGPSNLPFFQDIQIYRVSNLSEASPIDREFGEIKKAYLTDPPMDDRVSNFEEFFASSIQRETGIRIWRAFDQRDRTLRTIEYGIGQEEFWRSLEPLAHQTGSSPVLLVSRASEGRVIRDLRYERADKQGNIRIEHQPEKAKYGSYIATVNGIDLYGSDFENRVAWLFSGNTLSNIQYSESDDESHCVEVNYATEDGFVGQLQLRFSEHLTWSSTPIFEIKIEES